MGNIIIERKIAPVIGNANYDASGDRLENSVNNAKDMTEALQRRGFKDQRLENYRLFCRD